MCAVLNRGVTAVYGDAVAGLGGIENILKDIGVASLLAEKLKSSPLAAARSGTIANVQRQTLGKAIAAEDLSNNARVVTYAGTLILFMFVLVFIPTPLMYKSIGFGASMVLLNVMWTTLDAIIWRAAITSAEVAMQQFRELGLSSYALMYAPTELQKNVVSYLAYRWAAPVLAGAFSSTVLVGGYAVARTGERQGQVAQSAGASDGAAALDKSRAESAARGASESLGGAASLGWGEMMMSSEIANQTNTARHITLGAMTGGSRGAREFAEQVEARKDAKDIGRISETTVAGQTSAGAADGAVEEVKKEFSPGQYADIAFKKMTKDSTLFGQMSADQMKKLANLEASAMSARSIYGSESSEYLKTKNDLQREYAKAGVEDGYSAAIGRIEGEKKVGEAKQLKPGEADKISQMETAAKVGKAEKTTPEMERSMAGITPDSMLFSLENRQRFDKMSTSALHSAGSMLGQDRALAKGLTEYMSWSGKTEGSARGSVSAGMTFFGTGANGQLIKMNSESEAVNMHMSNISRLESAAYNESLDSKTGRVDEARYQELRYEKLSGYYHDIQDKMKGADPENFGATAPGKMMADLVGDNAPAAPAPLDSHTEKTVNAANKMHEQNQALRESNALAQEDIKKIFRKG